MIVNKRMNKKKTKTTAVYIVIYYVGWREHSVVTCTYTHTEIVFSGAV